MGLREALIAANDAALLDPHDAHARVIDDRAQLAQGQVEPTHGGRLGGMRGASVFVHGSAARLSVGRNSQRRPSLKPIIARNLFGVTGLISR